VELQDFEVILRFSHAQDAQDWMQSLFYILTAAPQNLSKVSPLEMDAIQFARPCFSKGVIHPKLLFQGRF